MSLSDQDLIRLADLLDDAADFRPGYDELTTGGRFRRHDPPAVPAGSQLLITRWINDNFFRVLACPFCRGPLASLTVDSRQVRHGDRIPEALMLTLRVCPPCRYWAVLSEHSEDDGFHLADAPTWSTLAMSKLRALSSSLPDGLGREAALHLRRHPQLWNQMDPAKLEGVGTDC